MNIIKWCKKGCEGHKTVNILGFCLLMLVEFVVIFSLLFSTSDLLEKEVVVTTISEMPAGKIIDTDNGSFFVYNSALNKNVTVGSKYTFYYYDVAGQFKLVRIE